MNYRPYEYMGVVLVCGGRKFTDRDYLYRAMEEVQKAYKFIGLVHGAAAGADRLAGEWWGDWIKRHKTPKSSFWGVGVPIMDWEWERHGNGAGPRRNQKMIDMFHPDLVVAFPGQNGTADMIRRATQQKIPVLNLTDKPRI